MPCKISHLSEPDRPYLVTHGFSGGNGISFPSLIAALRPPAPFLAAGRGSGVRQAPEDGAWGPEPGWGGLRGGCSPPGNWHAAGQFC